MKISSLFTALVLATFAAAGVGSEALAQAYPSRPVKLLVPFTPGGGTDILARIVAGKISESLGQQVVVENRPGANTIIATEALVRSAPDGYTLLMQTNNFASNATLYAGKLSYDTLKDVAPVSLVAGNPHVLVVNPSVPAKDLREFIALAKAKPGTLNYGSPGTGSGSHLAGELFSMLSGVRLVHVPYKGSGPALTDLLGGQIQLIFGTILSTYPHVKSGKLRALGVSSPKRSAVLPDIPSIPEGGVAGYGATSWNGVLTPAGVPKPIRAKLNADIVKALHSPEVRQRLAADGGEAVGSSAQEFRAHIQNEIAMWAKVIKAANIRPE